VYVQPLNVQRPQGGTPSSASVVELALTSPLFPLRPFHNGPVVAMTSPAQGLVATASQDGTLRMYDVGSQTRHSRILYQFAGYKVWVGSLCVAHGDRLYTDGADNQVIGHHFRGKDDADAAEGETKTADDGKAK
jgi:WD40 repeat protein